MKFIKILLFVIISLPLFGYLAVFVLGCIGTVFSEDWYFIWPMILIIVTSFILSAIIEIIIHNRKYGYAPTAHRWYFRDGVKLLTEEEEEQRGKESERLFALLWAITSIPALLIYFACMMIFY